MAVGKAAADAIVDAAAALAAINERGDWPAPGSTPVSVTARLRDRVGLDDQTSTPWPLRAMAP